MPLGILDTTLSSILFPILLCKILQRGGKNRERQQPSNHHQEEYVKPIQKNSYIRVLGLILLGTEGSEAD
jgi:hypothetical protein